MSADRTGTIADLVLLGVRKDTGKAEHMTCVLCAARIWQDGVDPASVTADIFPWIVFHFLLWHDIDVLAILSLSRGQPGHFA